MSLTAEQPWRLFFAIAPDARVCAHLDTAAQALALPTESHRVPVANYHLTVAFLGSVTMAQQSVVRDIAQSVRGAACVLRFDAYEYWPKPEVVVAAARTVPDALRELWQRLHDALAPHGLALDAKRLRPHVTLARKVAQAPVLPVMSVFEWPVRELCLMRSDTSGVRSAYTVVDTWPLLDTVEKA